MIRISSSLTLGLALFFPVFWFVFFGSLSIFIAVTDPEDLPLSNPVLFKTVLIICYILFGFLIYKSFAKLKRVELENNQLFITNYFKTVTFDISHIAKIKDHSILGMMIITLELDYKSIFGTKIRFLSDAQKFQLLAERINNSKTEES